jgi:riboflavin kinase/FMN adenylyltransferase
MRVIRGRRNITESDKGCVVTIGNFDGVHLGHQAILAAVKSQATKDGVDSMLVCFEPQPKEFFDFRFGADRSGGFDAMKRAGNQNGFLVSDFGTITEGAQRVSSTRIRACLSEGRFEEAKALLGRPYTISGRIVYGKQIGRTLGVPTANIQLHRYTAPLSGVYAVRGALDGERFDGVANVGVRPTVEDGALKPILEVHFFGLDREVYGTKAVIEFVAKIRDEKKFESLDALKIAISEDVSRVKSFFGHQ